MLSDPVMEKRIQAQLDRMDGGLFLDKEWDREKRYVFYSVKHFIDPKEKPFTALEWRNDEGPLPLSEDIIAQLYRQEGSIKEAFDKAMAENAIQKELRRKAVEEHIDAVASEHQKSSKSKWL